MAIADILARNPYLAGNAALRMLAERERARGLGGDTGASRLPADNPYEDYDDISLQKALQAAAGVTISGVAGAGNLLDIPGSMFRDALTLNNPFDQLLSPFSAENRMTGRGLLEQYGVLGRNRTGLDWGDVAGFGAELVLDPLAWITGPGRAITKAAQTAGKLHVDDFAEAVRLAATREGMSPRAVAGAVESATKKEAAKMAERLYSTTPSRYAEQVRKGDRALMSVTPPFTNKTLISFGTGEQAAKIVDKVYFNPASRYVRSLFDRSSQAPAGRTTDPLMMRFNEQMFEELPADALRKHGSSRNVEASLRKAQDDLAEAIGSDDPAVLEITTRRLAEGDDVPTAQGRLADALLMSGNDNDMGTASLRAELMTNMAKRRMAVTGNRLMQETFGPLTDITKSRNRALGPAALAKQHKLDLFAAPQMVDGEVLDDSILYPFLKRGDTHLLDAEGGEYYIKKIRLEEKHRDAYVVHTPQYGPDGKQFSSLARAEDALLSHVMAPGHLDALKNVERFASLGDKAPDLEGLLDGLYGGVMSGGLKGVVKDTNQLIGAFREVNLGRAFSQFAEVAARNLPPGMWDDYLNTRHASRADRVKKAGHLLLANDIDGAMRGLTGKHLQHPAVAHAIELFDDAYRTVEQAAYAGPLAKDYEKFLDSVMPEVQAMLGPGGKAFLAAGGKTAIEKTKLNQMVEGHFSQLFDKVRGQLEDLRVGVDEWGFDMQELADDYAKYFPRGRTVSPGEQISATVRGKNVARTWDPRIDARHGFLKDLPGGTETVKRISIDQRVAGPDSFVARWARGEGDDVFLQQMDAEAGKHMARRTGNKADDATRRHVGASMIAEDYQIPYDQAAEVMDWAYGLDKKNVANNIPVFDRGSTADAIDYTMRALDLKNGLENVGKLGQLAKQYGLVVHDKLRRNPADGMVSLYDWWTSTEGMKLNEKGLRKFLGPDGIGVLDIPEEALSKLRDDQIMGHLRDVAQEYYLPQAFADNARNHFRWAIDPAKHNGYADVMNGLRTMWSQHTTVPFPAYSTRNLGEGAYMNMVETGLPAKDILGGYLKAIKIAFSKGKRLGDEDYKLLKEALDSGAIQPGMGRAAEETLDNVSDVTRRYSDEAIRENRVIPSLTEGVHPLSLEGQRLDKTRGTASAVRGFKRAAGVDVSAEPFQEHSTWFLARLGENLSSNVEFVNRFSQFSALRKAGHSAEFAAKKVKATHFDYSELTQFEKNWMRPTVLFYCVPEENSQALTRDGWKRHDELAIGEEVLSYNRHLDALEWVPLEDVAVFDYDDELMTFKNTRGINFEFTPNHRWVVETSQQTAKRPYGTYHYKPQRMIVQGCQLKTTHKIRTTAPKFVETSDSLLTPEQARLLGWIVTDGTVQRYKDGRIRDVGVYQSPKKFLAEVQAVAGGNSYNPHPDTGVIRTHVPAARWRPIAQYLHPDKLTAVVTRLSREAAEAMYDAMYKADGATAACTKGDFFAAEKPGVLEAFRILAYMLGRSTYQNKRGCYVHQPTHNCLKVANATLGRKHYKGRVWCPKTRNNTWVMLQNGMITITGNTWQRKNIPRIIRNIIDKPGGIIPQSIRAQRNLGREMSENEYVPSWLSEGFTMQAPSKLLGMRFGSADPDTTTFLRSFGLPYEDLRRANSDPQRMAQILASDLHPLIKAPFEWAAGTSFYSGQKLSDIQDPRPTAFLGKGANFAMANSPLGRFHTALRQATDPRKTWPSFLVNQLTGFKLTDVDMPYAQRREAQRSLEEAQRKHPEIGEFPTFYLRQQFENPDADAVELMLLHRAMQKRIREQAQTNKK